MLVFRGDLGNETDDNGAVGAVIGRRVCFPAAVGPVSATTLAIDCDGTVWGWGSNFNGLLRYPPGAQEELIETSPMEFTLPVTSFRALHGSGSTGSHVLAIDTSNTLWAWGANSYGQIGDGNPQTWTGPTLVLNDVMAVDVGNNHSVALKTDGSAWTWGANGVYQLGYSTSETTDINGQPVPISSTPGLVPEFSSDVTAVAAAGQATIALINGTVWQAGILTTSFQTPAVVPGLPANITDIACGVAHCLALDAGNNVWAWGDDGFGQRGSAPHSPLGPYAAVMIPDISDVHAIAAGGLFSVALKTDGTVWTWGDDRSGQLGDGTPAPDDCFPNSACGRNTAGQVMGLGPVLSIAAGHSHVIAVAEDGDMWSWGLNFAGQIGAGLDPSVIEKQATPVQVKSLQ